MRAPQINRIAAPPPEEILDAVKRGQKYSELSVVYGVSESTLRRRVQESDLVVRRRHGATTAPLIAGEDPEWMADGLCAQVDPEAFFPEKGGSPKVAKSICSECPVRVACLAYALDTDQRFGVWGMTTHVERRRMQKGAKS